MEEYEELKKLMVVCKIIWEHGHLYYLIMEHF